MEELHVAGMMKNHSLAWTIGEVGMGEFGRQLEYKAAWSGSRFVKADRWFPPSKQCSRCHRVKKALSLSERVYSCTGCGLVMDRDLNAAINIRTVEYRQFGGSLSLWRSRGSGSVKQEESARYWIIWVNLLEWVTSNRPVSTKSDSEMTFVASK